METGRMSDGPPSLGGRMSSSAKGGIPCRIAGEFHSRSGAATPPLSAQFIYGFSSKFQWPRTGSATAIFAAFSPRQSARTAELIVRINLVGIGHDDSNHRTCWSKIFRYHQYASAQPGFFRHLQQLRPVGREAFLVQSRL